MTALADLRSTLTETDAATVLDALILRTLDAIEKELDWYFGEPRAAVEILNGSGSRLLWLRQYIVGSTVSVQYRGGVGDAWETVDADDYEFDTGGRLLANVANWIKGVRNYRVSYTEGFATMPGDVEQLLLNLVVSRWNNRENDAALRSETIGDYSYTRGDLEEMPGWGAVWARWKRGRI
jgi:hypothetical protein